MVFKTVIDVMYFVNESRKAAQLIVLSPFGLLAGALFGLSFGSHEL